MRALFLWLLVGLVVEGKTNEGRHIQSNVEVAHRSSLGSNGMSCQSVIAYYEGTFRNKQHPDLKYTAQFQVRLNASQSDKRIYIVFDRWNQTLAPTKPFSFDFAYDGKDIIGSKIGTTYSGPFASNPSDFTLTLNHGPNQDWDNSIHIMYFHTFNNSFQLENAVGQCTKKQLEMKNVWNMDPTLVNYCVCCGDYLPSGRLGCPTDPWSGPMQTTTVPSLAPVSCRSIVGYYEGAFKNEAFSDEIYSAQFQFRMTSDTATRRYRLKVEGWNQTVSRNSDFSMLFYYDSNQWCDNITVNETCSAPFGDDGDYSFGLLLVHGHVIRWDNAFRLFWFDPFDHAFTFKAVGKCTNDPPNYYDDWEPDRNLYKVCLCCDDYSPNPVLNCPSSQWT